MIFNFGFKNEIIIFVVKNDVVILVSRIGEHFYNRVLYSNYSVTVHSFSIQFFFTHHRHLACTKLSVLLLENVFFSCMQILFEAVPALILQICAFVQKHFCFILCAGVVIMNVRTQMTLGSALSDAKHNAATVVWGIVHKLVKDL